MEAASCPAEVPGGNVVMTKSETGWCVHVVTQALPEVFLLAATLCLPQRVAMGARNCEERYDGIRKVMGAVIHEASRGEIACI